MKVVKEIVYFESAGRENTLETLKAAKKRAMELGIRDVVVASTSGETGVKACEIFKGFNLIIVRHHTGFMEPGVQEMRPELEKKILEAGARILTCTHALAGVERGMRKRFGIRGPVELIAEALRLFGEGMKVCVEIAVMAADAGLIPIDRNVICVAGTGHGADTAIVVKPAHSSNFFDLKIVEIIAMPMKR